MGSLEAGKCSSAPPSILHHLISSILIVFGSCTHSFLHTAAATAVTGRSCHNHGSKVLVESVKYSPRLASSRFVAHPFICSSCLPPSKTRKKISRQEPSSSRLQCSFFLSFEELAVTMSKTLHRNLQAKIATLQGTLSFASVDVPLVRKNTK
jgi:hypothetical protein